jgi:hypothetical protein
MQPLHAVVKKGRLTLDEPTELPDGQVVLLLPLEELLRLAEDAGAQGMPAFSFSIGRDWRESKPVDAAALIEELRSM